MSGINFESSWKKTSEREAIREARKKVLEHAEAKGQRLAERAAKEQSWMLPDLDAVLKDGEAGGKKSKSHKKHKKEKKAKKSKKSKHKKKKRKRSSSSSSDSSSEDEWVEKDAKKDKNTDDKPSVEVKSDNDGTEDRPVQREDWMAMGILAGDRLVSRKDLTKAKEEEKQAAREERERAREPGRSSRELNPYFKDGGSGLPTAKTSSPAVSSGGASWLRRAFKRAQEQAEREGVPLEEIAAQRWGSIEKFQQLLAKAEGKDDAGQRGSGRSERRPRSRSRSRSPPRERRSFHRPSDHDDRRSSSHKQYSSSSSSRSAGGSWKSADRRARDAEETRDRHMRDRERERELDRDRDRDRGQVRVSDKPEKDEAPRDSKQPDDSEKVRQEPPPQEKVVVVMSEAEMNALGAKIVKAEMLGNTEKAKKLKEKLDNARKAMAEMKAQGGSVENATQEETVILTRTDSKGMTRPVETDVVREQAAGGRRKKGKVQTHAEGERVRYFADDDRYDLKAMFQREKLSTAEDQNSMMSRLAGKAIERTDDDYDIDDVFTSRAAKKTSEEQDLVRDRDRAVREHQRLARTLEECRFCFGGPAFQKHLMVAIGKTCYLALPQHTSLTEDHCYIVPMSHVKSVTMADEDVFAELLAFRKALTRMYEADDDRDCVFFETAMGFRHNPHMVVECVPLPRENGDTAPMFFQKAIQECETEWSNNKKLITLSKEKDVRRSVPKGLPYFHVDFGMQNGFAHVIEDEELFPRNFAAEIIGGMLDLEPRVWRHPKRESFEAQKKKILSFGAKWKQFDFTKKSTAKSKRDRESSSSSSSSDQD